MSRLSILLLFGGESSEHDVSVMSASNVFAAMDNEKYDVALCYIDRNSKWWLLEAWPDNLSEHGGVQLAPVPGTTSFLKIPGDSPLQVDVLFPVLHGENGHEDGAVQGIAQFMHIPVIGCGVSGSVVSWDKLLTKQLAAANGLNVVPYEVHRAGDVVPSFDTLTGTLSSVLFVKPTVAGSSIGVSKVERESELAPAIIAAHKYSDVILIEQAIVGRELEVAVLGNPPNIRISGVGEIIPGESFYSYEDKYSSGSKAKVIINAEMKDGLRERLRQVAGEAYTTLGCKGLARVDFLVSSDETIYLNELNTLPGFTNISQYPKLWQEQGLSYSELIDRLIDLALE